MTPRPDIVAIREEATIGELRELFREQEYSRFPVYKESLDNIAGFVFIKDLVLLDAGDDDKPIRPLVRPAVVVPETKRVPELLQQFQRQQTQCAIVVDEYGGTAGLVTIEDLLEEIVGEIRDEYDVESEQIVDEGNGRFRFQRQGGHRRSGAAAECPDRAGGLRDGRRVPDVAPRPCPCSRRAIRRRWPVGRSPRCRTAARINKVEDLRSSPAERRRAARREDVERSAAEVGRR